VGKITLTPNVSPYLSCTVAAGTGAQYGYRAIALIGHFLAGALVRALDCFAAAMNNIR
jgi:hypothetical protein